MPRLSLISKKIIAHFRRHPALWLFGGIFVYWLIFITISLWKYFHFGYNGLDLAIFNQVLFNSSHGNLYYFTIHPQSYLGDHFNLWLAPLSLLYSLWRQPQFLLIWQTIILGATAWPIFKLAKKFVSPELACLIGWTWLLNPLVQNTNVFEFHELPLAIFLFAWLTIFWLENRSGPFYSLALLSVMVREDVALAVMMFGLLAIIERRKIIWWLILPLGFGWFLAATKLISLLNPLGHYKFLYYYQWLGKTLPEIIINGLTQPWLIFDKLISPQNLAMTLALFLPFAFINFRWSKYWLLALPIYFQLILGGSINALIVIKTHYSNLLLLPLFLVFILGLAKYQQHSLPKWWQKLFSAEKKLAAIVVTVAIIYVSLTMGPILPWLNQLTFGPKGETAWAKTQWQLAKLVPPQASLLSSYAILSALSSREKIYALNYAFTGKQQLSDKDYNLTEDLEAILIDTSDLLFYQLQAQNSSLWRKQYPTGDDRLRQIIAERHLQPNLAIGPIVYFNKFADSPISLWSTSSLSAATNYQNISLENNLHFLGWSNLNQAKLKTAGELLPLSLFWQANQTPSQDWQLQLTVVNKNNSPLYQKIYPLAYGLYPTSAWQPNEIVQTNYWFWLPPNLPKNAKIQLQLIYPKGSLTLNDLGSLDYLLAKPTLSKIFLTLPAAN